MEEATMITKYLREAMHRAKYKILEDGTYYGWIEELPGVWATAGSLEECREELGLVVEDWLLLGLRLGHNIPSLGDVDLNAEVQMVGSE
jgi:predicted RNase H-like HicB family nuclease